MGQNVINYSSSYKRILNIMFLPVKVNIIHTIDRRLKERLQMLPEISLKLSL